MPGTFQASSIGCYKMCEKILDTTGGDIIQYACGHSRMELSVSNDPMPLREKAATLCIECSKTVRDMSKVEIRLTVDWHPSGNRTLKFQAKGHPMPIDFSGPLLTNDDPASFYRAVAQKIADLSQQGLTVIYNDTSR